MLFGYIFQTSNFLTLLFWHLSFIIKGNFFNEVVTKEERIKVIQSSNSKFVFCEKNKIGFNFIYFEVREHIYVYFIEILMLNSMTVWVKKFISGNHFSEEKKLDGRWCCSAEVAKFLNLPWSTIYRLNFYEIASTHNCPRFMFVLK